MLSKYAPNKFMVQRECYGSKRLISDFWERGCLTWIQREDELVRFESEVCGRSRCERKVKTCETLIGRRLILTDHVGATS